MDGLRVGKKIGCGPSAAVSNADPASIVDTWRLDGGGLGLNLSHDQLGSLNGSHRLGSASTTERKGSHRKPTKRRDGANVIDEALVPTGDDAAIGGAMVDSRPTEAKADEIELSKLAVETSVLKESTNPMLQSDLVVHQDDAAAPPMPPARNVSVVKEAAAEIVQPKTSFVLQSLQLCSVNTEQSTTGHEQDAAAEQKDDEVNVVATAGDHGDDNIFQDKEVHSSDIVSPGCCPYPIARFLFLRLKYYRCLVKANLHSATLKDFKAKQLVVPVQLLNKCRGRR
ncbi:hypothetical protein EJB05_53239, partial [Eragrostis curvula]